MMNQEDESETSETSSETASSETETSQTEEDKSKYIKGIWFEEEYIRKYPYGSLACDVIGFTNSGNVGAYDWKRSTTARLTVQTAENTVI